MEKLKISFALQSPLITNGGYMTLDGLLAALIFEQGGDLKKAHADIPLKNTNEPSFENGILFILKVT